MSEVTLPRLADPTPRYRTRLTERFTKWTFTPVAALSVFGAVLVAGVGGDPLAAAVFGALEAVAAAGFLWAAWVRSPKLGISVEADGIRIQTWFRTRRFAWSELHGFTVRLGRMYVVLTSGRMIVAPGLGTTTFARSGSTFDMAEELNSLLAERE